jgi:hypothetical protein
METEEEPNYNPFTNGPVREMENYKPKKKPTYTKPKPPSKPKSI